MKVNVKFLLILYCALLFSCIQEENKVEQKAEPTKLEESVEALINFDSIHDRKVMVVGTFHFDKSVLATDQQASIQKVIEKLKNYQATKILLEWEPQRTKETNLEYQKYLADPSIIHAKVNEVYQLGFRLAKALKHDSLYLFDDQTPYIGSLAKLGEDGFSFSRFNQYAQFHDSGFYDKYQKEIIKVFDHNQQIVEKLALEEQIALINSPEFQDINAKRMHLYEVRVGIQENWVGPDWLGRWYRRNIRMLANTLKISEKSDKILIIVGDNHKWILDELFGKTPDFEVVPSWEYLN